MKESAEALTSIYFFGAKMKNQYFIKRGEKVHGPFSQKHIRSGLEAGKIRDSELASPHEDGPWSLLESLLDTATQNNTSMFDGLELPEPEEAIPDFYVGQSGEVREERTLTGSEPKEPLAGMNKRSPSDLLGEAEKELNENEKTAGAKESLLPVNIRYPVHFLWACILSFILALVIPLFCFIPMGFLYKYFNDRDEDLISYFYLGGGVISAIGSVVFLGMAWQGSLKLGEQTYNRTAKQKSSLFQDGWTHPLIWLFSEEQVVLSPEHEKTKRSMENLKEGISRMAQTNPPPALEFIVTSDKNRGKGLEWETKDGWGTEMNYQRDKERNSFTILSAGPDKKFDTGDDIRYTRIMQLNTGAGAFRKTPSSDF